MKKIIISFLWATAFVITFLQPALTPSAYAAAVADYQATPPFLTTSTPPLVMLTMGRDHKLYYEAYPDTSDLNGDGVLDIRYNPSIDYYGYFDPYKVYIYSGGQFAPHSVTTDKTRGGVSGGWSGNFLNYLTTSRMDALRKVLYGGYRSTDSATTGASSVVLQRVYIPQDAHSWGKEYTSTAVDGYDIADYAPFTQPVSSTRHLFASTTLSDNGTPILRVAPNNPHRIWEWVSKERPVCDNSIEVTGCTNYDSYPADHSEFSALVTTYATIAHQLYDNTASNIDGSGNPCTTCIQDYYLTVFSGYILIKTAGTYQFAVDGDDAVEVMIDGVVRASWYGGHGSCGCTSHAGASFTLTTGEHTVEFRHQERTGGDNYHLYWNGPDSGSAWQIVPAGNRSPGKPSKVKAGLVGLRQKVYDVCTATTASLITDYTVKVVVCDPTMLESNCKEYSADGTNKTYKPVGLLQKYGEGNKMYFGLITGSYTKNRSGGVLRKKMGSITDEINATTGQFTTTNGIIQTINKLRTVGFNYSSYSYEGTSGGVSCNCGWIVDRTINEGECRMWGNPIAEMMYEGVRYFAGKASPTSAFTYSGTTDDSNLGLPQVTSWNDPYDTTNGGYPACSKPVMLVISDINPSYDTDQLPGSAFPGSFSGDVSGLNVADLANTITTNEAGVTGSRYIGESGGVYNGACTPKSVSSLDNTRGLCPEEPTKEGGYYSGSVAYFGEKTDLNPVDGDQKMDTFAVALASPLPRIEIPMGSGKMITLVPFAKSVGGNVGASDISPAQGDYQPTDTIIDFYVEELTDIYGKFRINYEDVEQGADHDMDAIVIYEYWVTGDTVKIKLTSEYAAGSIIQHMGYIISGTTADGTFLEVRDKDTAAGSDPDYFLDTPPGILPSTTYDPAGPWLDGAALPLANERTFTVGAAPGATLLTNPLWYAAKWGGFKDYNDNDLPDQQSEWDEDNDGTPDTYFYVTNPLRLEEQLEKAFTKIIQRVASATAVSVLSTSEQGEGSLFQAYFKPSVTEGKREVTWTGYLQNLWVDRSGNLREDTVQDEALVYTEDDIIKFVRNTSTGDIEIHKFHDSTGDCVPDDSDGNPGNGTTPFAIVSLSDIKPVWEAGKRLAETSAGDRTIKTFVDADKDGIVDSGEFIDFKTTNKTTLRPYLRAATDTEANNLIEFIRGVQFPATIGYRDRKLTVDGTLQVWKLGDIVYSTPSVVGKPLSNYNVIYNDATYDAYYRKYKDRDSVVYVGANDGMLHAFWGGKSEGGDNSATTPTIEASWYSKASGMGTNLGEELWAYIPYNLLSHLKWLADPNYPHVYYVDLKPRYADVKIFTPDTNHPNGWGTILIGGMRLGGKPIAVTDNFGSGSETRTFRSAYFALDITVPNAPKLLWEYTDTTGKLGLTTSYPTIIKVKNKWFAFFGSGPTDLVLGDCTTPDSNKKGDMFVLDLLTGAPLKIFATADNGGFFSDPVTVDTQVDYSVDTTYIPETYQSGGAYQGKIYRLWAKDSSGNISDDPTQWVAPSALFNTRSGQPVTSGLVLSYDALHNLWAFFGTGKYMGGFDKTDSAQQTFYGIKEPCVASGCAATVVNDDDSLFNTTDAHIFQNNGSISVEGVSGAATWQALLNKVATYPGGWYFNLWKSGTNPSERVINRPTVLGGIVLFTSFIPDTDVCSFGGSSYLYALNYITGTAGNSQVIGTSDSTGEILNKEELGVGMASGIAIHTGGGEPGANKYIQMSTGQIIGQKVYPPGEIKSGIASWRETK